MNKYKDLVSGICGLIFSAGMFFMSIQIASQEDSWIGAGFLPEIASVIMFITFCFITYRGAKEAKSQEPEKDPGYKSNYKGVVIMLVFLIAYAALLRSVGFIITSIVFLYAAIYLMTKKENFKPVKYGIITVVLVVFVDVVFTEVFGIRFPGGIL